MSREVCAVVDVHVRIYGDCGHQVDVQHAVKQLLVPSEALAVLFESQPVPCAQCKQAVASAAPLIRRVQRAPNGQPG